MADQETTLRVIRSFSTRWGIMSKIAAGSSSRDGKAQHSAKSKLEKRYFEAVDGMLRGMNHQERKNLVQEMFQHDWPLLLDFFQKNRSLEELCENFRKALSPTPVSSPPPPPPSGPPATPEPTLPPAPKPEVRHHESPPAFTATIADREREAELESVGAALALQHIESFRFYHPGNREVGPRLMEVLKKMVPNIREDEAETLIRRLKEKAGSKYAVYDDDDDIPF